MRVIFFSIFFYCIPSLEKEMLKALRKAPKHNKSVKFTSRGELVRQAALIEIKLDGSSTK